MSTMTYDASVALRLCTVGDDEELMTLEEALLALLDPSLAVSLEHATAPKAAIALRLAAAITLR